MDLDPGIFKLAIENAPIHMIITDKDGKIVYANKPAEMITGFSVKEMVGKTPRLWGNQMGKAFYQEFWNIIKNQKQEYRGEFNNKRKNGEKYIARVIVKPLLSPNLEIIGFLGIEEDITDLKEAKENLMKTSEDLQKTIHNKAKSQEKINELVNIIGDYQEQIGNVVLPPK